MLASVPPLERCYDCREVQGTAHRDAPCNVTSFFPSRPLTTPESNTYSAADADTHHSHSDLGQSEKIVMHPELQCLRKSGDDLITADGETLPTPILMKNSVPVLFQDLLGIVFPFPTKNGPCVCFSLSNPSLSLSLSLFLSFSLSLSLSLSLYPTHACALKTWKRLVDTRRTCSFSQSPFVSEGMTVLVYCSRMVQCGSLRSKSPCSARDLRVAEAHLDHKCSDLLAHIWREGGPANRSGATPESLQDPDCGAF